MKNNARIAKVGFAPRLAPQPASESPAYDWVRPEVRGKFLWIGEKKFYVRGVTYGPFEPDSSGDTYPAPAKVKQDFSLMSAHGINAIRTYNAPPRWLLDLAQEHGLRVLVGLQGERHFAFLDDSKAVSNIKNQIVTGTRRAAGHPAVLCYTVANEIPAHIVRWYGARRIERFIRDLYGIARNEDPESLFTYANYPTTEYLDLPFLDLLCFNVFLESQPRFEAYLVRLQNLAGDRPLIMSEIGLDSRRNGELLQVQTLNWQIGTSFAMGAAGVFVFSWTDEWHNRGDHVQDWDFGVTNRDRAAKPALKVVSNAFADIPFSFRGAWPRVSVVVCSFNGSRTIRQCLQGLEEVRYPNFEVIVIDDGSTDGTGKIAREYDVRVIHTPNRGLSSARNTGLATATGEIIAYLDDDACPDPDWLSYLVDTFQKMNCAGVGGPNIPFLDDGNVAACIGLTLGRPTHVLLSDREAEHIPGCNMAFRRDRLQAIGGFDTQFRVAGDDVDVCWRLQNSGGKLGFSPAAMVWHHCRKTVRAFWKQQVGYGKAEAMLERKWPEKYDSARRIAWGGRVYSDGLLRPVSWRRGRIYHGIWGTAGYTRLYHPPLGLLDSLPSAPEWLLANFVLVGLSLLALLWHRLLPAVPLTFVSVASGLIAGSARASRARFPNGVRSRLGRFRLQCLTAFLYVQAPLARVWGRLGYEIGISRIHSKTGLSVPLSRRFRLWTEERQEAVEWLRAIDAAVRAHGIVVRRGGDYDDWDLEVCGNVFGNTRIRLVNEEYGARKQMVRVHASPRFAVLPIILTGTLVLLSALAASDHAWIASAALGAFSMALAGLAYQSLAVVTGAVSRSLKLLGFRES